MRHAPATLHFSYAFRSALPQGSIEWEELPPHAQEDAGVRAALDEAPVSQPFREPVKGVSIREVTEPDVFRHFFGR